MWWGCVFKALIDSVMLAVYERSRSSGVRKSSSDLEHWPGANCGGCRSSFPHGCSRTCETGALLYACLNTVVLKLLRINGVGRFLPLWCGRPPCWSRCLFRARLFPSLLLSLFFCLFVVCLVVSLSSPLLVLSLCSSLFSYFGPVLRAVGVPWALGGSYIDVSNPGDSM